MSTQLSDYNAHNVVEWTHYLTHPEVDALQELARSLPPEPHVVNLGAGNGTSGLAFMQARPDLHLYTVDIQLEPSPFGCLSGELEVFRKAGIVGDPRHEQIHADSAATGHVWLDTHGYLVDMVFIDAGHQEWECRADILAWLPNIKSGGVMAVHDFEKTAKVWRGVDNAVRALLMYDFEQVLRVDTLIAFKL